MKQMQIEVTIEGETFIVRRARSGDLIPHMHLVTENPAEFQRIAAGASVLGPDGEPLRDRLMDVDFPTYFALIDHVMEVNRLRGKAE